MFGACVRVAAGNTETSVLDLMTGPSACSVHVRVRPLAGSEKESAWQTSGPCKIAPTAGGDDIVMDNVFDEAWTTAEARGHPHACV